MSNKTEFIKWMKENKENHPSLQAMFHDTLKDVSYLPEHLRQYLKSITGTPEMKIINDYVFGEDLFDYAYLFSSMYFKSVEEFLDHYLTHPEDRDAPDEYLQVLNDPQNDHYFHVMNQFYRCWVEVESKKDITDSAEIDNICTWVLEYGTEAEKNMYTEMLSLDNEEEFKEHWITADNVFHNHEKYITDKLAHLRFPDIDKDYVFTFFKLVVEKNYPAYTAKRIAEFKAGKSESMTPDNIYRHMELTVLNRIMHQFRTFDDTCNEYNSRPDVVLDKLHRLEDNGIPFEAIKVILLKHFSSVTGKDVFLDIKNTDSPSLICGQLSSLYSESMKKIMYRMMTDKDKEICETIRKGLNKLYPSLPV